MYGLIIQKRTEHDDSDRTGEVETIGIDAAVLSVTQMSGWELCLWSSWVGSSEIEGPVMCKVELDRPCGGMHMKIKKGPNMQIAQLGYSVNHKNIQF